jgi:hypothetical protein
MDPTPTGPNPEWDSTPNGPNPEWDSIPNGTQPRMGLNPEWTELRMGLNLEFLSASTSNFYQPQIWCTMCTYIKRMDLKRENTSVYFSQKKVIRASTYTSSAPCWRSWKLKMFFTAVEIVPFEVDRNLRGWVPFGVKSIQQYVESHSKFSPVGEVEQINLLQSWILLWSQLPL